MFGGIQKTRAGWCRTWTTSGCMCHTQPSSRLLFDSGEFLNSFRILVDKGSVKILLNNLTKNISQLATAFYTPVR